MIRSHNSPFSHYLVLSKTDPLTSGGNLQLVDGQIGLFKNNKTTVNGLEAQSSLQGAPADQQFVIQVGNGKTQADGNSTNKNMSTIPFTKSNILDITYSPAKAPTLSSVTLGYNGVAGTGFQLKERQATTVSLTLMGDQISYLGYRDGRADFTFTLFAGNPDECQNCSEPCASISCKTLVSDLVDRIKNHQVRPGSMATPDGVPASTSGAVTIGDLIDVIPNFSCAPKLTPTGTATYYTLTIEDEGTQEALAEVQAQYPTQTITRASREGITSVYEMLSTSGSPASYAPGSFNELLFDCECPNGYTEAAGGWVYIIEREDDGSDISATLLDGIIGVTDGTGGVYTITSSDSAAGLTNGTYTGITGTASASGTGAEFTVVVAGGEVASVTLTAGGSGYVVGETITIDGSDITGGTTPADDITVTVVSLAAEATSVTKTLSNAGSGTYVVVFSTELDDTQEANIIASNESVTLEEKGFQESLCIPDSSPSSVAWVSGDSCTTATKSFQIDLKDTLCGESRLAELQAAYPTLTITEDSTTEHENCRRRYLTTVTSNVVCEGCETPEYEFEAPVGYGSEVWVEVTPEAGSISSYTVVPDSTFDIANDASIAVAAGSITTSGSGTGAAFTVNAEADGTFKNITLTSAGSGYAVGDTLTIPGSALSGDGDDDITITVAAIEGAFPTDCECGVTFKAKESFLCPPAMLAQEIGAFTPKGLKIQVSGGEAPAILMEGYEFVTMPFKVTRDNREFYGSGWGYDLCTKERESVGRFLNINIGSSYAENWFRGFETKLEPCSQYDTITLKLDRTKFAGTGSRRESEVIRYVFVFDSGRVCDYKDFFNELGGALNCPSV